MVLTGQPALDVRELARDDRGTERHELIAQVLEETFPGAAIDACHHEGLSEPDSLLKLSCRLEYPPLQQQGNRILLRPFDYMSATDNPFVAPVRKESILLPYTEEVIEAAQLELPTGWRIEALPEDTTIENSLGRCSVTFTAFDNYLKVQRTFALRHAYLNPRSYYSLQQLYQWRQDIASSIVMLVPTE